MRLLFAFAALMAFLSVMSSSAAAQQPVGETTISGSSLPDPIRLTRSDHDAFVRRLDLPPLLDEPPAVSGPVFLVTSPYWDEAVRAGRNDQEAVSPTATYYQDSGFVLTKQGGKDVWTALDTKQRDILDRYIRLAASLPPAPTSLELLRAAAMDGEVIGITVGQVELTPAERTTFWQSVQNLQRSPETQKQSLDYTAIDTASGAYTWVVFSLPESRSIQMLYSVVGGGLAEPREVELDGVRYNVPANWLVPVLGSEAAPGAGFGLQPLAVPQEKGSGSPLWWVAGIGCGMAALAVAYVIQKRFVARKT